MKPKPLKKLGFATVVGMRGIKQIILNFLALDHGLVGIGQFHFAEAPHFLL